MKKLILIFSIFNLTLLNACTYPKLEFSGKITSIKEKKNWSKVYITGKERYKLKVKSRMTPSIRAMIKSKKHVSGYCCKKSKGYYFDCLIRPGGEIKFKKEIK